MPNLTISNGIEYIMLFELIILSRELVARDSLMPQEIQMFLLMFLIGTWHPGFLVIIDEAHRGIPDEGSKIKNMPILNS